MKESKKQLFHLEASYGLINDPNGLSYFNGKYYVFFQWNKLRKDHSYKEWGLFTSQDMLNWKFVGTALFPDKSFDINGIYSGSGCVINDQLCLFYTGNTKNNGQRKSYQCLAVSYDGIRFYKRGPVLYTPPEYTEHFRDPKVIQFSNKLYYMIIGAQLKNGCGAIALAKSNNGFDWKYLHPLAYSYEYQMIECPDLLKIDNQFILLYSLQRRNNTKDEVISSFSCYKFVNFDLQEGKIDSENLDQSYCMIDYGFDFYAPQTFVDEMGRTIMYAWMSRMNEKEEKIFSEDENNIHCLTMPRELFVKNNKLYQRPVKEIYQLLHENITEINQKDGNIILTPQNRIYYLNISNLKYSGQFSINTSEYQLLYNLQKKELELIRTNWITQRKEKKTCHIKKINNIELWSDQSSIEVFVNDGEYVFSSRIFPLESKQEIVIKGLVDYKNILLNNIVQ